MSVFSSFSIRLPILLSAFLAVHFLLDNLALLFYNYPYGTNHFISTLFAFSAVRFCLCTYPAAAAATPSRKSAAATPLPLRWRLPPLFPPSTAAASPVSHQPDNAVRQPFPSLPAIQIGRKKAGVLNPGFHFSLLMLNYRLSNRLLFSGLWTRPAERRVSVHAPAVLSQPVRSDHIHRSGRKYPNQP